MKAKFQKKSIEKMIIDEIGYLDANNNRECKTTIYKSDKGITKSEKKVMDIKKIVENYFSYLCPNDKVKIYFKYFHNHNLSSASSSSASSGSKKERKTSPTFFKLEEGAAFQSLKDKCLNAIQADIESVKVHETLYNEKDKLRVKITIHYKDRTKDKKHIRKGHLLELYEGKINPSQRHIVDIVPNRTNDNNVNNNNKPIQPGKQEPLSTTQSNHNNSNIGRNNIMSLERPKPKPIEQNNDEESSVHDCECTLF